MKRLGIVMLLGVLFAQVGRAQDYTRWNLPEGALVRLGKGSIRTVAYSPDGTRLAVNGSIGVWLYDAHTGAEVALLPCVYRDYSFSPDGSTLACMGSPIRLWDTVSGQLKPTLEESGKTTSVSFSPDGSTLAGNGVEGVLLWDGVSGKLKATIEAPENFQDVLFSPDGSTLAGVGQPGRILLWDVVNVQLKATLHGNGVRWPSLSYSTDGSTLASAENTGVQLWDVASGQPKATLEGHLSSVRLVAFSPNGNTLATSGRSDIEKYGWPTGRIGLWDTDTGRHRAIFEHGYFVSSLSFSPDGSTLAVPGREGTVLLWDMSPPYKIKPIPTVVQSVPPLPEQTALQPNYPNPFNSSTQIPYRVSAPGPVRLVIYNTLGQPVRTLVDAIQAAGAYQVSWDGRDHRGARGANGVYLYRLQAGEHVRVRKMMILE